MKIICAWCGADMGEKELLTDMRVSQSICKSCVKEVGGEIISFSVLESEGRKKLVENA